MLAMTGVGDRLSGQITLACVPTAAFYFLPRAIERFSASFPRIRFRILDLSANDGLASVAQGEAEFGINLTGSSEPDLTFTPLSTTPSSWRVATIIPWRRSARSLEGFGGPGLDRRQPRERQPYDPGERAGEIQCAVELPYEVNHLTTSLGLVERGLGISVLPKLATPPASIRSLSTKAIGEPSVERTIGLVERRAARLSPPRRDSATCWWPPGTPDNVGYFIQAAVMRA